VFILIGPRPVPRVLLIVLLLAACGPDYSPNTYNSSAVQQANKVEKGVVVGVRPVDVSANTSTGALTGAAAGGIAGSQTGSGVASAFGALGGSVIGGLVGSAGDHTLNDTTAYEYVVQKPNGDLLSVTQKDPSPLSVGDHVLVIAGSQARIVLDYTVAIEPPKPEPPKPEPPKPTPLPAQLPDTATP
jgi:outer membrane lipoprotein SlyB